MIFLVAGLLLVLIGYLIKYRQVYWLIKGYVVMPQEKKDTYDMDALSAFVGKLHFMLSPLFLFVGVWMLADLPRSTQLIYAVLTLSIVTGLWALVHIRRSKRFRRR